MKKLTALIAAGMMMLSAASAFAVCHNSSAERYDNTTVKAPTQTATQTNSTAQTQRTTR